MTHQSTEPRTQPMPDIHKAELPSALTFFVTRAQRAALLRQLNLLSKDRNRALLIATGLIDACEEVR